MGAVYHNHVILHDMAPLCLDQVGIFGPTVAYDLSARLNLPIGKRVTGCLVIYHFDAE